MDAIIVFLTISGVFILVLGGMCVYYTFQAIRANVRNHRNWTMLIFIYRMNQLVNPQEYRMIEIGLFAIFCVLICIEVLVKCLRYIDGDPIDL